MNATFADRIEQAFRLFITASSSLQSAFLLSVRLFWGWQFFQAGWGKLNSLEKTTEFFASLGIPLPGANAVLAASTECFGGLLLLVGLASRLTSLPLAITMIVAYGTAEKEVVQNLWASIPAGTFFEAAEPFVAAAPFLFLLASLIILIFGPGKVSLDHLIAHLRAKQKAQTTQPG